MTLVVEDGSGNPNAESYVTLAEVKDYASKYSLAWFPDTDEAGEAACRVATQYVDATYRFMFQGTQAKPNQQALEWPRSGVYYSGNTVDSKSLPKLLKKAVCEAAVRQASKPGCLTPDTNAGANITQITAESVAISYVGTGLVQGVKVFPTIGLTLSPLLQESSPYSGSASRC